MTDLIDKGAFVNVSTKALLAIKDIIEHFHVLMKTKYNHINKNLLPIFEYKFKDTSEDQMRDEIEEFPDGTYEIKIHYKTVMGKFRLCHR